MKNVRVLSHVDQHGKPNMVDISDKDKTQRSATAAATVVFPADVYTQLKAQNLHCKKGSIVDTAHIAGIMAAKKTSDLIPMCHPLPIDSCKLQFNENDATHSISIEATVKVTHKTGVEMEALTAVNIAALTIYDMCKALSHDIVIKNIRLLEKTGGKSDKTR